ncbi:hypothetical protein LINGRAHAP2_LOCUS1817 [Linum grandiflorum]
MENLQNNDGDCVEIDGKNVWPKVVEQYLIGFMVEEVKKENRTTTTFCKTGWKNIKQRLKDKFTKEWDDNQLKNKYNQLRKRHKNCKSILGETGMGFTAATGKLDAPEDVWDRLKLVSKFIFIYFNSLAFYFLCMWC